MNGVKERREEIMMNCKDKETTDKTHRITVLYVITMSIIGGAQVHLLQLLDEVLQQVEPHVVVGETGWLYEELVKRNIPVYCVDSLVREISPLKDLHAIYQIAQLIKRIKPDVVHCHSSKAGIVGRIAAKWSGVLTVFTAHGWAFTEGVAEKKRKLYARLERMAACWTAKILCVSEYDKNLALQVMPEQKDKLILVHNGIRSFSQDGIRVLGEQVRFVMVARFMEPKDQETVLKAAAQLKKDHVTFVITFVGDGEKLQIAKELAAKLQLNEQAVFLGARSDIEQILMEQDVFLLISKWEGLPISILEALRAGLPVIASNVGGIPETVDEGVNGFLVGRENSIELASYMKRLISDRVLMEKMGKEGRKKFEAEFTSVQMAQAVIETYKDILNVYKLTKRRKFCMRGE